MDGHFIAVTPEELRDRLAALTPPEAVREAAASILNGHHIHAPECSLCLVARWILAAAGEGKG